MASTAFKRFASGTIGSAIGHTIDNIISECRPITQFRSTLPPDRHGNVQQLIVEGKGHGLGSWTARISTCIDQGVFQYETRSLIDQPVSTDEMLRTVNNFIASIKPYLNAEHIAQYMQQIKKPLEHSLPDKNLSGAFAFQQ